MKGLRLTMDSFLFNPFTIATCLARPTSVITNTLILQAVAAAANGRSLTLLLALGFASYLSLHPVLLLPPLLLLCYNQQLSRQKSTLGPGSFTAFSLAGFVAVLGGLLAFSTLLT